MIVGERKTFEQIWESIKSLKSVMILGCGTCVSVCQAGGEKEVGLLASELRMKAQLTNTPIIIGEFTIERQCDKEFFESIKDKVKDYEAVLSMACGAGVQFTSDIFETIRVLPALNTRFIGVAMGEGLWTEKCRACGLCIVGDYGGICPMTICAKNLLNGPCGGSKNGKCEAGQEKDCAWVLIYNRLKKQNRLDILRAFTAAKDNQTQTHPGNYTNIAYIDPTLVTAEEKHAK
jgi:ferredoxin